MACKEVEPGQHDSTLVLTNGAGAYLYQAYLGRVVSSNNPALNVFVDDNAIVTGTTGPLAGDSVRTWYDGISYAQVLPDYYSLYNQWIAGYGLSGTNALPGADYDGDGVANVLEFILGGNPTVNDSASIQPTFTLGDTIFEYDFRRTAASNDPLGFVTDVYYSTDLVNWTKAVDGVNGVVRTELADFYGPGIDKVAVQIPRAVEGDGPLFVHLVVSP